MGNRKPRSEVDRLPVDYEQPRSPEKVQSTALAGDSGATLTLPPLPPDEREARNQAAVRYLRRRGADDLIDVLGLAPEVPPPPKELTYRDVPCPQCPAGVGKPCVAKSGVEQATGHRGRCRRAQELREAAA